MMREIIFIGKRLNNGEWVEGSLWIHGEIARIFVVGDFPDGCDWVEVDPDTVGQYIGRTDRNGKRIFEGNVLRYGLFCDYECFLESIEHPDDYDGEVYDQGIEIDVVKWCGERYDYPAFDLNDHQFECNGLSQIMCGDYEYEIIGNIHDHPELLEVVK